MLLGGRSVLCGNLSFGTLIIITLLYLHFPVSGIGRILQFTQIFFNFIQVKNPLEENEVVGITNYIDFGFELQTRYFHLFTCVLNAMMTE